MGVDLEAVESLMALGLTEYESRCFVALTQLSGGTAKEVSRLADVPQSRVYDVGEQLHRMGVVDVQESEPRRYRPLQVDRALDRLREEYDDTPESVARQLNALETRNRDPEGVWEVADRGDVAVRFEMQLTEAEEVVHLLLGDGELLGRDDVEALRDADRRDVTVFAEVPSASLVERLHEAVPEARVAVSELSLERMAVDGCQPGRLVLVDRRAVLLSAQTEGLVPNETAETGLWSSTVGHGVVDWLRPLLAARREALTFETA